MEIWFVSIWGLLLIMHLWTFLCKCLHGCMFSVLLNAYLDNSMSDIWGSASRLLKHLHYVICLILTVRVLISLCPHQHSLWCVFLIVIPLLGVKWYFIVVLFYISLTTNVQCLFLFVFLGHLCIFLRELDIQIFGSFGNCPYIVEL